MPDEPEPTPKTRRLRGGRDTAAMLIEAAAAEFNEHGFAGTDTNRISRRAGLAPQTFYRRFQDKTDVFVAVYLQWIDDELAAAGSLIAGDFSNAALIESAISYHRKFRIFRRSLRLLALEDPRVREARARSRLDQVARIRKWLGAATPSDTEIAIFLLKHERLCDAIADGELEDLGIDDAAARKALAALYGELRTD